MKMNPETLRLAVEYTSQLTGFSPRLVEKDYYCSLFLERLYHHEMLRSHLAFKGGTLLSKAYLGFFRLSEDLDFSASNEFCTTRTERREVSKVIKAAIDELLPELGFSEVSPLRGFNESRQYNGVFGYKSVTGVPDTIKFEVGFRGDLMLPLPTTLLETLLVDPFSTRKALSLIMVKTLVREEAFAEKARAALTRKFPAIRDLFDLVRIAESGFDLHNEEFLTLVRRKLSADADATADTSIEKKKKFESQVESELKVVLRKGENFDFEDAWKKLENLAQCLR